MSQLQPAQVRTLREGFEILDRDSDGIINREDVADMLNQLGKQVSSSSQMQYSDIVQVFRQTRQMYPSSSLLPHPRR